MPLVWAHAEHIKLLRSLRDGAVFDMPPQTYARYVKGTPRRPPIVWRTTSKVSGIAVGRILRLEFLQPASVHWSSDNWGTTTHSESLATGLGTFICDLPTQALAVGVELRFTMLWTEQGNWEGNDFLVVIGK
jgi:glucoamylase